MNRSVVCIRLFLTLTLSSLVAQAQQTEIYRRVDLLETRTGVAKVRVVYNPRLNVPVGCDDGSQGCVEGFRFTRLYALELGLEARRAVDGGARIVWEDKGEVFLALQFESEDEAWFDAGLREYLSSLSADAFAQEYARIEGVGSPLHGIPRRSPETSWSCFRSGRNGKVTRYDGFVTRDEHGEIREMQGGTSTFPLSDSNPHLASLEQFCDEMSDASESAFPDEVRTMPVPRTVIETVVEQVRRNTLAAEGYEEELVPLPGQGQFTRKGEPGMISGGASSSDEQFTILSRGQDGIMWTARTEPAEVRPDIVADNAWLSRWKIRTEERKLGPYPARRLLSESMLTMTLVPTLPSVELDEDGQPVSHRAQGRLYEIRMDESAFMDEIATRLDKESSLDLVTLERLLTTGPAGFESEGWIQIICRPGGTALYGIVPTGVKTPLLNADLFCAAVDSQLN